METINHFIGGSVAEGSGTRYADVYNPALGEPCARVRLLIPVIGYRVQGASGI